MSLWSRIVNVFRGDRLSREIDEELQSHIDEAIAQGRDPVEVRRAFGSALRLREESRDVRLVAWLESLRADAVFGWRQLKKNKVTSAAAILSLALGIGACTGAFRLIDALLLRPLPVAEPERLHILLRQQTGPDGKLRTNDSYEYPVFSRMRAAVRQQADLTALSYSNRTDVTYGSDQDQEKAYVQYVSGWMFDSFGLRPALGRLLTESDDVKPGAHPYAVLSHDYWAQRFGQDPKVLGRTFRVGDSLYEIVGVGPERFTGIEPGTATDIFIPTMMNAGVVHSDWSWLRVLARLKPGVSVDAVGERLRATFQALQEEQARAHPGMPSELIERFFHQKLLLKPAASGVSDVQNDYRRPLAALGGLVALVLLIACANVTNLRTAQAAARTRELALRVSIGAGRRRLVQLVLIEGAWLGLIAAAAGGLFAWWSAPMVVRMINPPDNPLRLSLPADWRVLGFGVALTFGVTLLFGLAPALRASAIQPVSALKGGEDPHSRRRLMHALVALQTAFCFSVLFVAALFVGTTARLSHQPTGFSAARILTVETIARPAQSPVYWDQAAEHLRTLPGVEKVALAEFPLLSGNGVNGIVSANGGAPLPVLDYFLNVSPGWTDIMRIPLLDGRDFRPDDIFPDVAIVNQAFAKQYFNGQDPVGKSFEKVSPEGSRLRLQIVGLAADARYRDLREPITPTAYVPLRSRGADHAMAPIDSATFIVRTRSANPLAMASTLRREVSRARPEFRVSNILTQAQINGSHTVRERLLARLALFFAAVALLLAAVGLYGVLNYSVLQRRREIGIRMALGAPAADIARHVTTGVFVMVLGGALAGLALGMVAVRYIESLFYQVKPTDLAMLAIPSIIILAAAALAALPATIRAVTLDPVTVLRSE
jgi:predicted permease